VPELADTQRSSNHPSMSTVLIMPVLTPVMDFPAAASAVWMKRSTVFARLAPYMPRIILVILYPSGMSTRLDTACLDVDRFPCQISVRGGVAASFSTLLGVRFVSWAVNATRIRPFQETYLSA